ncbi:hypothetical protein [Clostridium formicaceticum]|uniref:Uncharacterized protein n=1 Tax=Clostridium formicaceticum TaxID=1497 RepID=A0AAC9WHE7_9CLOT|nr:hypothetical protein [Clostridium formicaceticum]ARE88861.1 hypothetical protein CLFO_32670 [Clostridium formicaceticum]
MGECKCQKPKSKSESEKCSEKQTKECHGDDKGHPCNCEKK